MMFAKQQDGYGSIKNENVVATEPIAGNDERTALIVNKMPRKMLVGVLAVLVFGSALWVSVSSWNRSIGPQAAEVLSAEGGYDASGYSRKGKGGKGKKAIGPQAAEVLSAVGGYDHKGRGNYYYHKGNYYYHKGNYYYHKGKRGKKGNGSYYYDDNLKKRRIEPQAAELLSAVGDSGKGKGGKKGNGPQAAELLSAVGGKHYYQGAKNGY